MRRTEPYISAALNLGAVLADALAIFLLIREPMSYFTPYRRYFISIYVAFIAFPLRELVLVFYSEQLLELLTTQLFIVAAVVIAVLWGQLVTKLYFYPEDFSLRSILSGQPRPIYATYLAYLVLMAAFIVVGLGIPGSIDTSPTKLAVYLTDNTTSRAVGYSPTLLALAASVGAAFIVYPFFILARLRSELKDHEIRESLKVIASCFGGTAAILFATNALSSFGFSILGPGHLASVVLLMVSVRAFRRPTFLKAFLGVIPSLVPYPRVMSADRVALLYDNEERKYGPLSKYIDESITKRKRVVYFHYGKDEHVQENLASHGVNLKQHLVKDSLRLLPIQSLYKSETLADEEDAINFCQELASEARAQGREGLTIIIDYGEHAKDPYRKFATHLTDPRWISPDGYVQLLLAFSNEAFKVQNDLLAGLKSRIPVIDLSEIAETFSRSVGMSHVNLVGKKILIEYDPLSDYERVLKTLIMESTSAFEHVVLFTRKDSPVYSYPRDKMGLKTFVLTTRVAYPKVEGDNQVLLPAYDGSLLLDALNRTLEAYIGSYVTVVFDSLSHYIFTMGMESTQSLARRMLELMVSDKISAFFLINTRAHDQRTLSIFENLFDLEFVCKRGARIPEVKESGLVHISQSG